MRAFACPELGFRWPTRELGGLDVLRLVHELMEAA
jgi:hypothetical protein